MNPNLPANSFDQVKNQLGNLYQRFGPQLPSHNPTLFQNLQTQPQAANVLNSAQAAGMQLNQNVGQPLSQGFFNVQKPVFNALNMPGQNVVQPALQRFGVSPQIAGVAGLATDIFAPGPGEFRGEERARNVYKQFIEKAPPGALLKDMERFIDYVRVKAQPGKEVSNPHFEANIRDVAKKFGLNPEVSNSKLANQFDDILSRARKAPQYLRDNIGRFTKGKKWKTTTILSNIF